MSILGSIIGVDGIADAAKAITQSVSDVLKRIIPDADKRMEVEAKIQEAATASITAQYAAMQAVMVADSQSESWMTRNARPAVVFWCLGAMTWLVISPAFGLQAGTIAALKAIPSDLWNVVMISVGGYIFGKSGVDIAKAIKK